MSRILITGAAGFISSQLAYRLYKMGDEVTLLDNFSYGLESNLVFEDHDFNDEIIKEDIRNTKALNKLFKEKKFDIVYHFAGIAPLPDCQNDPVLAADVNVVGTVNILELSRKYGVKNVIFASTSAVYENNTDFPSIEENVVSPSLIYPVTKYCSEHFCKAFYDAYKLPIVCLRFANVYGPHMDYLRKQPPVVGYIIRCLYNDESPIMHSNGKQERDFVYVEDLIDLAIKVSKNKGFDIVNVSSEKTISINKIIEIIAKTMNKEHIKIKYEKTDNYWKKYPDLYEGYYKINNELLTHEVEKYTLLSNKHAEEKYGWRPTTSIEQGIKETVEYAIEYLKKWGN